MEDLELKKLKKIEGDIFEMKRIPINEMKRQREICTGEIGCIQIKLDNLEFKKKKLLQEVEDIDTLLSRKNDYIKGGNID